MSDKIHPRVTVLYLRQIHTSFFHSCLNLNVIELLPSYTYVSSLNTLAINISHSFFSLAMLLQKQYCMLKSRPQLNFRAIWPLSKPDHFPFYLLQISSFDRWITYGLRFFLNDDSGLRIWIWVRNNFFKYPLSNY